MKSTPVAEKKTLFLLIGKPLTNYLPRPGYTPNNKNKSASRSDDRGALLFHFSRIFPTKCDDEKNDVGVRIQAQII